MITTRQQNILDYIQRSIVVDGRPPTFREIGKAFNISSPNGVVCNLKALEKKGYIQRRRHIKGAARDISLTMPDGFSVRDTTKGIMVMTNGLLSRDQARELAGQLLLILEGKPCSSSAG